MKKTALGRGLDALFPQESREGEVVQLSIDKLDTNPGQPRQDFNEAALLDLAASIRQVGLLQPILVTAVGERYRIIAGERRFRAAVKAGLTSVPVLVRAMPEHEQRLAALTENLQREDLNAMEAAQAVRLLMDEGNLTQEQASKMLGKSRPALANLLRLLSLDQAVQDLVRKNQLSEGHARVLAGIASPQKQRAMAQKAVAEELSVRALEALAKKPEKGSPAPPASPPPELREFETRLLQTLGVRAQITGNLKKGRIVLRYASFDELEGIYEAIARLADET